MPLYEYRCDGCSRTTEQLVLAGDVAETPACPSCGSQEMHRLLSKFAAGRADAGSAGFDAATACGGGPCKMPDMCGSGGGGMDFN